MTRIKMIFIIFTALMASLLATVGCGKISDVVNINYDPPNSTANNTRSSPFLGLSPAGGIRSSGSFELNGGVGNYLSSAKKTSAGFTLHGGIHGQLVVK